VVPRSTSVATAASHSTYGTSTAMNSPILDGCPTGGASAFERIASTQNAGRKPFGLAVDFAAMDPAPVAAPEGAWIFLSHSNHDWRAVREIRNVLEARGHRPLMFFLKCLDDHSELHDLDYYLRGLEWEVDFDNVRASIQRQIDDALAHGFVVLLLSPRSAK
jgi:hypothetical protein